LKVIKVEGADFNYNFKNNLIRFNDINNSFLNNSLFDFDDEDHYQNNIINGLPDFKNIDNNDYIIGEKSDANTNADKSAASNVPLDILGINRTVSPDIGAYQHIIFEE
jgi:hypothetical protein